MSHTKVVQKIKTRVLCSVTFPDSRAIYDIMWTNTYGRAGQATDGNMALARCTVDT